MSIRATDTQRTDCVRPVPVMRIQVARRLDFAQARMRIVRYAAEKPQ